MALALLGCGDDDGGGEQTIRVSEECAEAFEVWEAVPYSVDGSTDDEANAAARGTLEACGSGEEWLEALRQNPAALGLTTRATITADDLALTCGTVDPQAETPACSS